MSRLPADGQQAHDNDCRAELLHALLDDNAVNGPAGVVGKEGLSCQETRCAQGASAARGARPLPPEPLEARTPRVPLTLPMEFSLLANSCFSPPWKAGWGPILLNVPLFAENRNTGNMGYPIYTDWGAILNNGHQASERGAVGLRSLCTDSAPVLLSLRFTEEVNGAER